MEDILKLLIESDRCNNDEFKALEKQIAEEKHRMEIEENYLLEDQYFYTNVLALSQAKFPPYNDKIYDYLISLLSFSDRHPPDPDPDIIRLHVKGKIDYFMKKPDTYWLWKNKDFDMLPDLPWVRIWFTWRKEQTEFPTFPEIRKAFMMLSRQEQVRLIQLYNTEKRQDRLNLNIKNQLQHSKALQHFSAKVIELQAKLSKLEKERALSIVQALKDYESLE